MGMRNSPLHVWGVLLAAMVVFVPATTLGQSAPSEVTIGFINPTTGVFGTLGKYARRGLDLALDNAKQNPVFKNVTFKVVERDSAAKVADAIRYARELIEREQVDVLMGGLSSAECLALQKLAGETKIVYVNSSGCQTDDFNMAANVNKYSFRINLNNRQPNGVFAQWLVKNVGKRWYVAYSDFAYGQSALKAFEEAIKAVGGQVVGSVGVPFGATDMAAYFSKVDTSADGLYFVFAGRDAILALQEASARELQKKMKFASMQSLVVAENFPKLPEAAENLTFVGEYPRDATGPLDNPDNHAFRRAYFAKYPNDVIGWNVFQAYRATNALLIGIEKSGFRGRKDADKLVAALQGLDVPGGILFPTGPLRIRKEDNQGVSAISIVQVKAGKEIVIDLIPMSEVAKIK